ncbi:MAG: hypothetical protein NTW29_22215 [Bacteroidetes bacterium]|nr:hypothetical protein [Bacteroidota bacterium]
MKYFYFFLLLILAGCSKQDNTTPDDGIVYINGTGLEGKWIAVRHYGSNGGGMIEMALTGDQRFTVEFKSDSTLYHSATCPTGNFVYDSYSLVNAVPPYTLRVKSSASSFSRVWYYGFEDNNTNELLLAVQPGIEPNYYRMKRIK